LINKDWCWICLAVGAIIVVVIFVVMMVFSGLLVDLNNVFSFLRWIQWVSAFRYAANVLTINEFRNTRFCLTNYTDICQLGNDILQQESIDYISNWDMWKYLLNLTLMGLVFFLMAYIRLLLIKKSKWIIFSIENNKITSMMDIAHMIHKFLFRKCSSYSTNERFAEAIIIKNDDTLENETFLSWNTSSDKTSHFVLPDVSLIG